MLWTNASRALVVAAASSLPLASPALALGEAPVVDFAPTRGAFPLASDVAAPILVDSEDWPGVQRAAADLQQDVRRVTGREPVLARDDSPGARDLVIVGTIGKSRSIDRLVRAGKLDVGKVRGRWESSVTEVVSHPWPGVERALVIAGSDKRGTIFGVYDLSEQIGVSPWSWWADVPVRHRDALYVHPGLHVRPEPAVKYRGIFINDEAPALSGWVKEKFGGFNHEFYVKVFELLLRLKANFLWPAMWGEAFNDDDAENPRLADEYGIVMGTSHHEPLMRAHDEWRRYGKGPWNYQANADVLRAFWTESVRRTAPYENIQTIGMRGDGDEPMSREANTSLLERIVADQRRIIARNLNPDVTKVPQVWALYKEVQEYYEKGMRVPDDVTLLWCDDNWGNIRRLPTAEERARAGGAGVYYHVDYVGGPRSYKWLNTVPIAKIQEQMHLAWRYGATRLWILNVGDIKPMELPIQFFLDYAWDPERWPAGSLGDYTRAWATREFGPEHAAAIADVVTKYTLYNGRRKPEMLEPGTYSLIHYREAQTVVDEYRAIERKAEEIAASLPADTRDAFYELVLYPVKACANLNDLYVTVAKNRLYAVQGRTSTNDLAERARELFREDARLSREYNESLAGGKWRHMMDQTHIGYTYWNQPVRNAMPGVQEVQAPEAGEMGVAVEGSEASWPGGPGAPALPALDVYDRKARYVEVFNRGRQPFEFKAEPAEPWLRVDAPKGSIERDQRISVSVAWDEVPVGTEKGSITFVGPSDAKVVVAVPILDPVSPRPESLEGFVEANGAVSIEAAHHTRAIAPSGREWKTLPDFGRTLSGVTAWPVTSPALAPAPDGMRLEYRMYLFREGPVTVDAVLAPTQKFQPGPGLRYGISFDDEEPQIVNVHADESLQAWERSVADGATVLRSKHTIAKPGYHVLKFWALDPGLVLEKLIVDTGGLRPSYLGPPESFLGRAGAQP